MSRIFAEINSVDSWLEKAPPKNGKKHWRDRRSAKELAKAWFPYAGYEQVPSELLELLESREETKGLTFITGKPEHITKFDKLRGENRNTDLVLWARKGDKKIVVCIEAKADEPFGEVSAEYVNKTIAKNERSKVPKRFSLMCQGLFGEEGEEERTLMYQLLTATAGTLVEADKAKADLALLIIHEFVGDTDPKKVEINALDLDRFVTRLSNGEVQEVIPGRLVGPFVVPGNEFFSGKTKLLIGKCRRSV